MVSLKPPNEWLTTCLQGKMRQLEHNKKLNAQFL